MSQQIRERFQEWVEKGMWQGEDDFTKNFAVGNVADWWLAELRTQLDASIKKIKGIRKVENPNKLIPADVHTYNMGYNSAVADTLSLIEQIKNKKI